MEGILFLGGEALQKWCGVQVGELQETQSKKSRLIDYDTLWWHDTTSTSKKVGGLKNRIWYQMDQIVASYQEMLYSFSKD